jgi:hypothetical protein
LVEYFIPLLVVDNHDVGALHAESGKVKRNVMGVVLVAALTHLAAAAIYQ